MHVYSTARRPVGCMHLAQAWPMTDGPCVCKMQSSDWPSRWVGEMSARRACVVVCSHLGSRKLHEAACATAPATEHARPVLRRVDIVRWLRREATHPWRPVRARVASTARRITSLCTLRRRHNASHSFFSLISASQIEIKLRSNQIVDIISWLVEIESIFWINHKCSFTFHFSYDK